MEIMPSIAGVCDITDSCDARQSYIPKAKNNALLEELYFLPERYEVFWEGNAVRFSTV